jgi:ribonuclease HI
MRSTVRCSDVTAAQRRATATFSSSYERNNSNHADQLFMLWGALVDSVKQGSPVPKYVAYTDGACRVSNPGLCSCAFVVYEDGVEKFRHGRFLGFPYSNNYAEYHGVIMLLEWADGLGYSDFEIWCDSQLIVKQVNCEWKAKENLAALCARAFALLHKTNSTLKWLRGHNGNLGNEIADEICNEILDQEQGKSA